MAGKLRPATGADSEFCYELHRRSMGPVVVEVFGPWEDAVQRDFHEQWFAPGRVDIVEDDDGTPIGVLDVRREPDNTYIGRIEILPEHQDRGVGSSLIRALLAAGRPVRLHVFTANVRARRFYERLGFRVEEEYEGRLTMLAEPG